MTSEPEPEKTHYGRRRERRHERYGMLGPILLVAIGVMFLVGQFYPSWGVAKTWPVLLIVIGVSKLLESAYSGRSMPPN